MIRQGQREKVPVPVEVWGNPLETTDQVLNNRVRAGWAVTAVRAEVPELAVGRAVVLAVEWVAAAVAADKFIYSFFY